MAKIQYFLQSLLPEEGQEDFGMQGKMEDREVADLVVTAYLIVAEEMLLPLVREMQEVLVLRVHHTQVVEVVVPVR
jgi:hypothetical protein